MSWPYMNGRTLAERLFSRLVIDPSGCLLWTGGHTHDGYGKIYVSGATKPVHRVMYEMFAGPVPDGLELDHLCRVRGCANVSHLEAVTRAENQARGLPTPPRLNALKTHCPAGHAYDLANTYVAPASGYRGCRACNRVAVRRYKERRLAS